MKIAIIADALDYQYAGIYYYTKELIKAIAAVDKENEYWIIRSKSEGDISHNVKELIIPTKSFPGAAAYRLFITIPNILIKNKVDIVVEPRHFGPFNLPKSIKRITVIHDLSPIHYPEWHPFLSRKLQQLFLPSILEKADWVITNSAFTAQDVINFFPYVAHKTTGILLGKSNLFQPQVFPEILEKYALKSPYLLHTGTIEPRKNLEFLVEAFEAIKANHYPNLELVLVGKIGWKTKSLLKKINNSPFKKAIRLLGYVERIELPTLYSAATIFTYPSHFEGFGLPVLEAMSCGVPCIVSDSSSLPEIVGDAGLTFPPDNQQVFIKHVCHLLSDKTFQENLSKKSLQRAKQFSWEKTAKATIAIFEQLMGEK